MSGKLTRREKRRLRRKKQITVFISSAILVFGSYYLVREMCSYLHTQALAADTRIMYYGTEAPIEVEKQSAMPISQVTVDDIQQKKDTDVQEPSPTMDIVVDVPKIDRTFWDLFERNNDVVGWISALDTINYPFVQRDNTYYLAHDYDKKENNSGWIFLDERNSASLEDDNIIIYGHNMKSGSMFGCLDDYKQFENIETYPIITIHSAYESQPRYYVIYSVFEASMNNSSAYYFDVDRISFEDKEEKNEYIYQTKQLSIYDISIEVDSNDQLLTLITCSYHHDNGRLIVLGRALRENESINYQNAVSGN